jgi:nucleotide-binding universal stress UspA family protein
MYRRILTAVDESFNAHAAARYAMALAQACGATLFVTGVLTPTMTGTEEGAMAQSAGSLVSEAEARGVSAHLLMQRGDVVKILDDLSRTHHIDVVMTASRRHDVEQRYFLHTVPQRLMAVLHCSLIIVRVVHLGLLAHPRQILVPVLGGAFDHAERAYVVSQLAAHFHAKLIVFHALEQARRRGQAVPHEAGTKQVSPFLDRLREAGTEPEIRIVSGPLVGEAIMQEAARHRHDLIIMGASQRSLFSQWQRGNPVEDVMRRTPCDLFVCRTRRRV